MTTATQAFNALRTVLTAAPAILDAHGNTLPFRFQNEDGGPMPDMPAAFAYVIFDVQGAGQGPVAFGGGRFQNTYRNQALLTVYVFVPAGEGLAIAADLAEQVAARTRSYRDADVSCFAASVHPYGHGSALAPPGMNSEVNSYYAAVAETVLHYDQIG
jgi:hypothetical protein